MKKNSSLIATLVLLMLITGCTNPKKLAGTTGGSEMLYANQWKLAELNGTAVTTGNAQLLFSPGSVNRVSGNAGCNKLNGTVELSGINAIRFSPVATTRMACEPGVREAEFTEALGKVTNWSILGNQLLLSNGKTVLARFNAVQTATSALNGSWELNYLSGLRIAFTGLYPDKKPQINFNPTPGELSGTTSCNGFSSKISVDGNKVAIAEPYAKTMIFCEGGGENAFLDMLKKVNRYAITDGNSLTFMIDDIAVMRFSKIDAVKD